MCETLFQKREPQSLPLIPHTHTHTHSHTHTHIYIYIFKIKALVVFWISVNSVGKISYRRIRDLRFESNYCGADDIGGNSIVSIKTKVS